jgi:hypothetical protein
MDNQIDNKFKIIKPIDWFNRPFHTKIQYIMNVLTKDYSPYVDKIKAKEMQDKKAREALEAEAATCSDPSIEAEVSRVSALFENPEFKAMIASTNAVANKLAQYDINEKKMKDGTLFPWQQDSATKKNYVSYSGGDNRIAALTYSMSSTRG